MRLSTLVIPHIAKTGGQTLRIHLDKQLGHNRGFIHLGPWGINENKKAEAPQWQERSLASRQQATAILGHYVYKDDILRHLPGSKIQFATCFRHPADRWLSEFNYKHANGYIDKDIKFWDFFYSHSNPNAQLIHMYCHFLQKPKADNNVMLDSVLKELASFSYVATIEKYKLFSSWICGTLAIRDIEERHNVSGKDFKPVRRLTDGEHAKLTELCQPDMILYQWANEWNAQHRAMPPTSTTAKK